MKRIPAKMILLLFCWLLLSAPAQAHKVNIFAWVEGDTVYTESKFSGGKVVKGGRVTVLDDEGALLLEGLTDDDGAFSFKTPKITDLTVALEAGTGHGNSWRITAAELAGEDADTGDADGVLREDTANAAGEEVPAMGLSAYEVEEIVSRLLDEKLRPINRRLAESLDRGPTLPDILGGMGYILGLVGLGAYIRYRKAGGKP